MTIFRKTVRHFKSAASVLFLSVVLSAGCSNSDNSADVSFAGKVCGNFVSYFNGFYNAQKEYNKALKLAYQESLKSGVEISSVFPVFKKGSVGNKELTVAVNKSTAILQNHPESDLADDALILMGKSYFYLGELPPAERKFSEVISNYPNSESIFEASLYLARTYAEQNKIENALSILNELVSRDDVVNSVKGEANLIIGERFYTLGDYESAKRYLETGAELFDDNEAVARAYYLLGKSNAATGNYLLSLNNLDDARSKSDLSATWYWSGVLKIRVYLMMNNFDLAQDVLDKLTGDDELLAYRKNLVLEQAKIYISRNELLTAENLLKQFIIDNPSSLLASQAYYELGLLRKDKLNPNFEIARYFFEMAGKGTGGDSLILKARREETVLKNYIQSFLDLKDLKEKVAKGIIPPDTTKKTEKKVSGSGIINDDILTDSEKINDDEKPVKPGGIQKKSIPVKNSQVGNTNRDRDFEDSENLNESEGLKIGATNTEILLTDEEVLYNSLAKSFKSKYSEAQDSISFVKLNEALVTSMEKIIEYFYFQTAQYDSVITYVDEFGRLFPESKKLPRLLYAKYNSLKLLDKKNEANEVLNQISEKFSDTKFGAEAKSSLGFIDSAAVSKKKTTDKYNLAISLLDKNDIDNSKKILAELSSGDTTHIIYPKILYALGYISEKYDRNWPLASSYYSKIQKSYASTPIGIELKKQLELETIAVVAPAAPQNLPAEEVEQESNSQQNTPGIKKSKKELTKFVITPNLPPRFKRQPKLADLSW